MQIHELETLLKDEIPLAGHLEISDLQFQTDSLTLRLPLAPNVNHKGTMFGGSLYSAAALACYALFLAALRENSIDTNNIVISEGGMKYFAPADQDTVVEAGWNSPEEKEQFFKTLQAKKKARVLIRAQIKAQNKVCAEFSGSFVAQL